MSASEEQRRLRLIRKMLDLRAFQLDSAEQFFSTLDSPVRNRAELGTTLSVEKDWPHAPLHQLGEAGAFLVTGATYQKCHYFSRPERLGFLESNLLQLAKAYGWQIEAWAVFSNHYHFVAQSPDDPHTLSALTKDLHGRTARHINELDGKAGRKVWANYWETALTYEKSYFARLSYVHQNPVKHGLVSSPSQYRWCSAAWFERMVRPSMVKTLYRLKLDRVRVPDDFEVE